MKCSLRNVRESSLRFAVKSCRVGHRKDRKRGGDCIVTLGLTRFDFLRHAYSGAAPLLLLSSVFSGLSTREIRTVIRLMSDSDFNRVFVASAGESRLSRVLCQLGNSFQVFRIGGKRVTCI